MTSPLPLHPFYFLRHGQTDWNVVRRIQGHTDIPLNATGLSQAEKAALAMKGVAVAAIISSPLLRAAVTAAKVHEFIGAPLRHDERLKERAFGAFEGQFRHDILARHNRPLESDYLDILPEDCETETALTARMVAALAQYMEEHAPQPVLFVGHGAFMAHLCRTLGLNAKMRFENAQPYKFTPCPRVGWSMATIDLTAPLG